MVACSFFFSGPACAARCPFSTGGAAASCSRIAKRGSRLWRCVPAWEPCL